MSTPITIDWCPARRIGKLQAFLDLHWQPGHVLAHDADLLRWQHRFPGAPESLSVLTARDEGGQIVGALGLILVPFCACGERTTGAWLTTWVATPAARAQQTGLRLIRRALDEPLGFIGTVGANDEALRIYRALGFSTYDRIARWVRVISADSLSTLLGERAPPFEQPRTPPPRPDSLRISPWSDSLAPRWERTWADRIAPGMTGTWRDSAYLRWRYLDHPRFTYAVRVAEDNHGRLRGLSVHRMADAVGAHGIVLRIVELLGDEETMTALAADAIALGERAGAAFADLCCTSAGVAKPLQTCGFTSGTQLSASLPTRLEPLALDETRLTGAFRAKKPLRPLDCDTLYVTSADADQDRPNMPAAA
jgi:hypothetical protein